MAFANRFHFRFDSVHGVEYNIYILQDGYSGSCDDRKLGRAPVLRKQKNGPVCGTSLDLYAECAPGHDGEFAELFTSNPKEYRVDVWRKVSGTDVLIWQGFVSTELYSEPSIYPPYDVQIVATDGLGELKLVDFIPAGAVTLSEHFRTALAYTGMNRTIYVASSLIMTGESVTDTFSMSINLDYMDGDSYYDMVTKLLDTLHATITLYGDKWLIARETDLSALLSNSGLSVVSIATTGTVSTTTIGGVHKTVGSMADNTVDTWPVGQLSTVIDPARKEVTIEAPWHTISGPDDPNMEATTNSPWDTEGIVRHDTTDDCFYELGLDPEHQTSDDTWGTIKQEIPINKLDCGFELKLRVAPRVYKLRVGDSQWYAHGNIKVHLEYDCYISSSHGSERTSTYIGTEEGWSGAPQHASDPKVEIPVTELDSIGERWLSITIPAISTPESASRYIVSDSATVRIVIEGHWVEVYECVLTPSLDLPGYRDIIHMDNDAVGAADTVEITGGRVRSDNLVNSKFYGGIWIFGGNIVTSFADSVHSNGDFLSITTLSYALSVAGRRLKTDGKLNIPAGFSVIPLFITFGEILSWIETWEWDLVQEEAQILAISLPAVEVDVESETVEGLPEGSGGSGGSGNGSSASSSYSYKTGGSSFFEEDGNGNIKLKDEYGGLWTKGFLTAGGVGQSSGGGGGDVDLPRVWKSLQNQDTVNTYNAYKISTAHLPDLGTGLAYTDNQGSGAGLATTLSIASGYKLPTTTEWSGIDSSFTIISSALQSLQAQIDSVATRDNFDELTATAFFADVIAASDIYGSLHGNADTATSATTDASGNTFTTYYAKASDLSSISSRVSTLEARQNWDDIFGIDSNGNVYVKKNGTTARGFWTYGFVTAGGVGQSSGGSGDVDLPRVWNSLQNQDTINTYNAYKISTAHLPTLGAGLAYTDNQGSGTSLATTLGIASGYKLPTTEEWANVSDNLNSLQALQAQVDSLSTRENFDELTASALFADVLAASDGYFGAIYGPLHGNADTATSATSAGSSTTASYLVSSSYGEGSGKNPIYFSGGRPVASSSSEGSASLPVYLSGGYLTACTASSLFSSLSSTAATNLSVTVAGQNRTATLYATYDTSSENIASNFSTVGTALKSLQSQIDSVATRNAFDELLAAVIAADTVAATSIYGALHGNADTATYATSASYATYDSASENIASNFTTVGTALKSLQAQIDSVAMNRAFDELTVTAGYFDMLSVGANLNVAGTIYSIKGIYSSGYVTAGAVGSSSDRRLKNDVEAISAKRASEVIMALRPCEWVWNEKHSTLEGRRSAGLIAQEVSDILPDMVIETNGELSLLHNVLHGYQISMLQDHETRIEELEKEVAALRKENTELKSRITA